MIFHERNKLNYFYQTKPRVPAAVDASASGRAPPALATSLAPFPLRYSQVMEVRTRT